MKSVISIKDTKIKKKKSTLTLKLVVYVMKVPGCSPRGMFNKNDTFIVFRVGFLTFRVNATPGTNDESVFLG